MRCSIASCNNVYDKNVTGISFHKFPNNPRVLTCWVAATGTPNFIPTHNSKVCSVHFEATAFVSPHRLGPEAVPTILLGSQDSGKKLYSDSLACILGTDQSMSKVQVTRDKMPSERKTIKVMKPDQPSRLIQIQIEARSTSTPAQAPTSTIKCVDTKKLLEPEIIYKKVKPNFINPSPNDSVVSTPIVSNFFFNPYVVRVEKLVKSTGITASQVLSRLREILPEKFDLSRMLPNEKVISLVIRYMKLDEKNEDIQNVVKEHLQVIIASMKVKDKKSISFTDHPYNKINDENLRRALAVIFLKNFTITDINNDLLGLLCTSLSLDIHIDAYHILIGILRQYTSEGLRFKEILNSGCEVDNLPMEVEDGNAESSENALKEESYSTDSDNSVDMKTSVDHKDDLVFVDVNSPYESRPETQSKSLKPSNGVNLNDTPLNKTIKINVDSSPPRVICAHYEKKIEEKDEDWEPEPGELGPDEPEIKIPKTKTPKVVKTSQITDRVDDIVAFLQNKKCSADEVLQNYVHLFNLCRFLKVRPRNSNVKHIETKLNYIIENNINIDNVFDFVPKRNEEVKTKPRQRKFFDKLKLRPVVVLRDVLEFSGDVLFDKKSIAKKGFHNKIDFKGHCNITQQKKYTSEQVRKLTDESYKQFRRIISKKYGPRIECRLKYAKLAPGTVVYAKNYRQPDVGWVKGVIGERKGPWQYEVKVENDCIWYCTADQLRPLVVFNEERTPRSIKPKQLFDL